MIRPLHIPDHICYWEDCCIMKRLSLFCLCLGLLLAIMTACGQEQAASNNGGLPLRCTLSEEKYSFSSEDLGGNFDGTLRYNGLEVSVTVGNKDVPLEDAIREGAYTVERLIADVQTDARNGVCQEQTRTVNGLTEFHYTYPDIFNLDIINDVYQTPDGQEHLFRSVSINKNGPNYDEEHDFTSVMADPEQPNILIDREDWGLTLEAEDISSTGLTLKVTQSGGQQAGTLEIDAYWISSMSDSEAGYMSPAFDPKVPILMDGVGSLTLNWGSDQELPSGEYFLKVWVNDNYDPETIHPLIRKFHDRQSYILFVTIP